jgi:prohead serine protease
VPEGKASYSNDGTRTIREIKLYEISLVAIPANPRATVTAVKSLADAQNLLKSLRDADIDAGALEELREIDQQLRRLLIGRDPQEMKQQMLAELETFAEQLKKLAA